MKKNRVDSWTIAWVLVVLVTGGTGIIPALAAKDGSPEEPIGLRDRRAVTESYSRLMPSAPAAPGSIAPAQSGTLPAAGAPNVPPEETNCLPAPSGLVAWWRFTGNGLDSVGTNRLAIHHSAGFVPGQIGQALSCNGTATHAVAAPSASLNVGAGPGLTIEGWIRPSDLSHLRPIAEWNDGAGGIGSHFWLSVDTVSPGDGVRELYANLVDTSGVSHLLASRSHLVGLGVWQHVALTYDRASGEAAMYLSGTAVAQTNLGTFTPQTASSFYLGLRPSGAFSGIYYAGALDEVSLYNRALSGREIRLVAAAFRGKCDFHPPPLTFDVSRDFSRTQNPAGPWSYGWVETLAGPLTLLSFQKDLASDNGVPISAWQVADTQLPSAARVMGPGTAVSAGGLFVAPEGTYYVTPGEEGTPRNFVVSRLTVPAGAEGRYRLSSSVRPTFDGPLQSDSDFHVRHNGQELFGQFLPANTGTAYSNTLDLAAGDMVDFAVGRGADGLVVHTSLKLQATLERIGTNSPPTPMCVSPPTGLVGWWSGESNALDRVGGNHGMLQGGVTFPAGAVGRAFAFPGGSNAVRIPARSSLDVGAGPGLTIEGWIHPADLSVRSPLVEWNRGGPGLIEWGVHLYILRPDEFGLGAGNLYANLAEASGAPHWIMAPGGTISANAWQHVALTYDKASGLSRLYRNGAVVAEANLGTFEPETGYDLYFGRRPAGDAVLSYQGLLDEMSLYNRALTPAELQTIHAAGSAGKCLPGIPTPTNAVTIRFEPPGLPGGNSDVRTWNEGGFAVLWVSNQAAVVGSTFSPLYPSNGTPFLQTIVPVSAPISIAISNTVPGQPFSLLSVDLAERTSAQAGTSNVTVLGLRFDNTAVRMELPLDGINDGAGPLPDFQTFALPPEFNNLRYVNVLHGPWALDNVRLARGAAPTNQIPPMIVSQPRSVTVVQGQTAGFSVIATGTPPLSYQWRLNGTNLDGATRSTLTISNAQPYHAGSYSVRVSNAFGSALSSNALLTIVPQPQPPMISILTPTNGARHAAGVPVVFTVDARDPDGTVVRVDYVVDTVGGSNTAIFFFSATNSPFTVIWSNAPAGSHLLRAVATDDAGLTTTAPLVNFVVEPPPSGGEVTIRFEPPGTLVGTGLTRTWTESGFAVRWLSNQAAVVDGSVSPNNPDNGGPYLQTLSPPGLPTSPIVLSNTVPNQRFSLLSVDLAERSTLTPAPSNVTFVALGGNGVIVTQVFLLDGIIDGTGPLADFQTFTLPPSFGDVRVVNVFVTGWALDNVRVALGPPPTNALPPTIVTLPQSQTVTQGQAAVFSVFATGTPPLHYQWRLNGSNIANAAGPVLTISNVQPFHAGAYSVRVTNAFGARVSSDALLTVVPRLEPPSITLLTPEDGSRYPTGQPIVCTVEVEDTDGQVEEVNYFISPGFAGFARTTNAPFSVVLSNLPPGDYTISAAAIDDSGLTGHSLVHRFVVEPTPPASEVTVRFEPPGVLGGTGTTFRTWSESGFVFRWISNQIMRVESGASSNNPANGSAYLQTQPGVISTPMIISNSVAGQPFSLLSVDLAERSLLNPPTNITFTGFGVSGSVVTQVFLLDGLIDGTGPLPDFQTFTFPPSFSNLRRVDVRVTSWAMDNVRLGVGVGPTNNQPPMVSLVAPTNGQSFIVGGPIALSASAMDGDGFVTHVEFYANGQLMAVTTNSPFGASFLPGVGTYSIQARATDNRGAVTHSLPVTITVLARPAGFSLVSTGSVWRYLFDGTDQGTVWRQPTFNDNAWPVGAAQLGYGDGDEATVIGTSGTNPPTAYFRQAFDVLDAASVESLTGRLLRDDGAVVYLNGVEVHRSNMPSFPIVTYVTLASLPVSGAEENTYFTFNIPASRLVEGRNVVAVELHQSALISTDASFDLGLAIGETTAPSVASITPANASVAAGSSITFVVSASGTLPLFYQWYHEFEPVPGGTNATLSLPSVGNEHAGMYYCIITNRFGEARSPDAFLTVLPSSMDPPTITFPVGVVQLVASVGSNLVMSVTATGAPPLAYQWYFNGPTRPIAGATTSAFSISNAQLSDAGTYTVVVSNAFGMATNRGFILTVNPIGDFGQINPSAPGGTFVFDVDGTNRLPVGATYLAQVYVGLNPDALAALPGAMPFVVPGRWSIISPLGNVKVTIVPPGQPVLAQVRVWESAFGATFEEARNAGGKFGWSAIATMVPDVPPFPPGRFTSTNLPSFSLMGGAGPQITAHPRSLTVTQGQTAFFSVGASGAEPLSYQWRINDTNIPGATQATLTISNTQPYHAGPYSVRVSNAFGAAVSSNALLTVLRPPEPPIITLLTPEDDARYALGQPVVCTVDADDIDGQVVEVLYLLSGGGFVGFARATNAPFTVVLSNLPPAQYTISADVTDDDGLVGHSLDHTFVVDPAPPGMEVTIRFEPPGMLTSTGSTRLWSESGFIFRWITNQAVIADSTVSPFYPSNGTPYLQTLPGIPIPISFTNSIPNQPFSLLSVDLAERSVPPPGATNVTIVGFRLDGTTVTATFPLDGLIDGSGPLADFQTLALPTTFNNLRRVDVRHGNWALDNVRLSVGTSGVPPAVTSIFPEVQTVQSGFDASFTVSATGSPPLSYQWQFNEIDISGATGPTLEVYPAGVHDAGSYRCIVSNPFGTAISPPATLVVLPPPPPTTNTLFAFSTVWRYNDSGMDLGTAWREPAYNDSAWPQGQGLLGFDPGVPFPYPVPQRTSLQISNRNTHYFRTHFPSPGDPLNTFLQVSLFADEGAVLYLNGAEVARVRMSGGEVRYETRASSAGVEGTANTFSLPPGRLLPGDNVLAVEVHQVESAPSDVMFGLSAVLISTNGVRPFPPTFESIPAPLTVIPGQTARFTASADGTPPLLYQWYRNGTNLPGATGASLVISSASTEDEGEYHVVVSNSAGTADSPAAGLFVAVPPYPVILTHPRSVTALPGQTVSLSITATSGAPFIYRWQKNQQYLAGANDATLTFPSVTLADQGVYRAVVSNESGIAFSSNAVLTVVATGAPPVITLFGPTNLTVPAGSNVTFSVIAAGPGPLSYQWQFNGANLPGRTNASLPIPLAQPANSGNYRVVVSNPFGSVTSPNAALVVVGSSNVPPVALSQAVTVLEDGTASIRLFASDPNGDVLTFTTTAPMHGTLTGTPPTLLYQPAPDYYGSDSFTFRAHDGTVQSAPATVTIIVLSVNDAPVALAQSVSVNENSSITIVLGGADVEGSALSFATTSPAHGTLSGTPPNLIYVPQPEYHGADSFRFKASDGALESPEAVVSITVLPVNDLPVAVAVVEPRAVLSATDTNWAVISRNGSNALVTLDGTLSHDADNDPLTYLWTVPGAAVPFAIGVRVTNEFEVGDHVVVLVVDDGKGMGSGEVQFSVLLPADAVVIIATRLTESGLPRHVVRPLRATLRASAAAFDRGHRGAGLRHLRSFERKVSGRLLAIDPTLASELLGASRTIAEAISP